MKRVSTTLLICTLAGVATVVALARPATETTTAAGADTGSESAEISEESSDAYGSDEQQADESAGDAAEAGAITIEGFAFGGTAVVSPGQSVSVENLDSAPHTVTAVDGSFDTGTIDGGGSTTLTLPTEPGTYEFFCAIHPSMVATVTVQA